MNKKRSSIKYPVLVLVFVLALLVAIFAVACDKPEPAPTVDKIEITTAPRVAYFIDDKFDASGMVVTATYSDGKTAAVTDYTISNTNALKATDTKITITYAEKVADVAITVVAIEKIEVTTQPTTKKYVVGEKFDATGMVVTAESADGKTKAPVTGYTLLPTADTELAITDTKITVTYAEKTAEVEITVVSVKSIVVKTGPTKDEYTVGETFDPAGMVVTVTYSDDSTKDVTEGFTTAPTTGLTEGEEVEITVTYTEGITTTLKVKVTAAAAA
ncbi:MAG: bacterial Ig-like domain-containing protein [Christensenellaceae bacterium]|jgi:hypothetical protein|nr:bacterial Ig-like domain-containing protein [Christensenellaceae bacterium]